MTQQLRTALTFDLLKKLALGELTAEDGEELFRGIGRGPSAEAANYGGPSLRLWQ